MPKYRVIADKYKDQMQYMTNFYMDLNERQQYVGIFTMELDGVTFYFIDNEEHFSGNSIYDGIPWEKNFWNADNPEGFNAAKPWTKGEKDYGSEEES